MRIMEKLLSPIMEKIKKEIDKGNYCYEFYDIDGELTDDIISVLRELGYIVECYSAFKSIIKW